MVTKANGGSLIWNSIAEATMVPMRLESRRARPTSTMALVAQALIAEHLTPPSGLIRFAHQAPPPGLIRFAHQAPPPGLIRFAHQAPPPGLIRFAHQATLASFPHQARTFSTSS